MESPNAFEDQSWKLREENYHQILQKYDRQIKEELETLKQCQSESYWYRYLPFCIIPFAQTKAFMAHYGILAGHVRYGAWPQTVFALFVGYFAGKEFYEETRWSCRSKVKSRVFPMVQNMRNELHFDLNKDHRINSTSSNDLDSNSDGKDVINTEKHIFHFDDFRHNTLKSTNQNGSYNNFSKA